MQKNRSENVWPAGAGNGATADGISLRNECNQLFTKSSIINNEKQQRSVVQGTRSMNSERCRYCYLDFDIDEHRSKLALAAAFVDATDSRYGFTSKDLRRLGGSEISRIEELFSTDHEWADKQTNGLKVRPPANGNRVVLRLFWEEAPLCCENFATLCTNGGSTINPTLKKAKPAPIGESGKPLSYKNCNVHRIVPGFIVQGGDFVFGNGSGGESIFNGKKFKDERTGLLLKHDRKGILSMGNSGKNSNTSQFFITFGCAPQCDGKHVVFGEVLSGFEVLDELEKVGNDDGLPSVKVQITDCGVFHPLQTPGAGYWYDQPDKESYTGKEPVFIVKPRVLVVAPNRNVYEKFQNQMSNHVSSISIQLEDEENDVDAMKKVLGYLGNHAIDVVIVAPACSKMCKDLELPVCWKNNEGMRGQSILESEVIIIAKPVEALASILEMSWLSRMTDWKMYD